MTPAAPPDSIDPDQPAPVLDGWPAAASALAGAEQAVDAVQSILRLARSMSEAGRRVDLGGLDELMGRLCARSLDLMPADGRRMALLLAGLLAEIDALNGIMVQHGGANPNA